MADYFKNTELAERYNISEATVRNWIKMVKAGKLKLELREREEHTYVADTISNIAIINGLVSQNRKYRNTKSVKTVSANAALFDFFSQAQVYDIVRNLELHHEIPRQYGYFGNGVKEWAEYVKQQLIAATPNMLNRTVELLGDNYSYIDKRLSRYKEVNVIDIGVGDATPAKGILSHLIEQGKLGHYIALDFSYEMLDLAKGNLRAWFGNGFAFEGYQLDIAHERFANILAENYLHPTANSINLILFLGAAAANLRVPADAFRTICESMNKGDLLIHTDKLAPDGALPEWFEYEVKRKNLKRPEITRQHRLVFDLLGIKESYYIVEVGFDQKLKQRYALMRFKIAVNLVFDFEDGQRVVSIKKGDAIILWRCWQMTPRSIIELHEKNGLYVTHSSQSPDHNYILTISEVKRDFKD